MNVRKLIRRRLRTHGHGVDVVGDVNAVIAANVNERGGATGASSRQTVVHRDGVTEVSETTTRTREGGDPQT